MKLSKAYTLVELLIVLAILGIIAGVGTPMYQGYMKNSKEKVAKNSLQSISIMEADYMADNSVYYYTSANQDQTKVINDNLFSGRKTLDENGDYYYYIKTKNTAFIAIAKPKDSQADLDVFCIDYNHEIKNGTRYCK